MKSKKGKILFTSIILLIIAAFFIFFQLKDSFENKKTENQKNLVANSKAVVYYSTTIDPNKRESMANFISKDNQVSPYYMDGLELGSVAYSPEDQTILLEDKYTLKFVTNNGMTSKKFKNPEYTGIKTGYLTKGHTFYSMNNTGIQEFNGAGYYSTIRYGNEQYVNSTLIEEWVQAVADNGMDTLYSLVCYVPSAEDGQKHRIVESTLTDDKKFKTTIIKELEEFEGRENIEVIGNLIYKDGHLYSLLFYTDKNEVWKYDIFDYDIKTKKVSLKNIPDYTSSEFVAMDTQQGIVINEDDMYFVSDNGDVHQINLETQKPQILYNLYEIYSSKDLAELSSPLLSIKENNLYIYYSTKDSYFLDKLDLKTGEIIQSNEMEGMEKALSFKKSVNPYYLLVLD